MPRMGLSQGEVAEAIRLLERAGLNPSIRMIREKLGRGSLTTIAGHKRALEAERQTGAGLVPSLPDPISQALLTSAAQFWQELVDAAQQSTEATRAESDETSRTLTAERDEARAEVEAARRELEQLTNRIAGLDTDLAERDNRLVALKEALVVAQAARDEATRIKEAVSAELAEARATVANLHQKVAADSAEIARLSERLEARTEVLQRNEAAHAALRERVHEHDRIVRDLNAALYDAEARASRAEQTVADADSQRRSHDQRETQHRIQVERLEAALADSDDARKRDAAAHAAQMAERDQRLNDLTAALNDAQVVSRLLAKRKSSTPNTPSSGGVDEG